MATAIMRGLLRAGFPKIGSRPRRAALTR
ncbi:MAG: hypothetical protein QM817_09355 [Archangium sp.]